MLTNFTLSPCVVCVNWARLKIPKIYTPLPIPRAYHLRDLSMDFILGLPQIARSHNTIYIYADMFLIAHFIPSLKTIDASCVINCSSRKLLIHVDCNPQLCLIEVISLLVISRKLRKIFGTALQYSSA